MINIKVYFEIVLIELVPTGLRWKSRLGVPQRDDATQLFEFVITQRYLVPPQQCYPICPRRAECARKRTASCIQ